MKQYYNIVLIIALISSAFFTSCSALQYSTSSQQKPSKNPEFIDGVIVSGGSSQLEIRNNKHSYDWNKNDTKDFENRLNKITEGNHFTTDKSLSSFIEDWYGTPYRFGGNNKTGIDCSAFVKELYDYVYQIDLLRTSSEQYFSTKPVKKEELKEGDLVFFKIHSKNISHVGVYLSNGKFVHASRSKGVMVSDLSDQYWIKYYAGGGRMI